MVLKEFTQTSADKVDYTVDYNSWLGLVSDTISSVAWTVPTGITSSDTSNTTTTATIYLTGGTPGTRYVITATITSAATPARLKAASFAVTIEGAV